MLLKLYAKLAPGWALIRVNFDPIQEIGPKVGGGHSFMSGSSFTRAVECTMMKTSAMFIYIMNDPRPPALFTALLFPCFIIVNVKHKTGEASIHS